MREWLVDRVRSQLDHGSYDEDKKIDMLLDRLAADLGIPLEDDSPDERTR